MKFLKSYKIFEMQTSVDVDTDYSIIKSNNDFMQQISEILLDLNDDGFETPLDTYSREGDDYIDISRISVEIYDPKKGTFNFSKLENSISHLFSFMNENDYVLDRIVYDQPSNRGGDEIEISSDGPRKGHKPIHKKYKDGLDIDVIKDIDISKFIKFYFITKKAKANRRKI